MRHSLVMVQEFEQNICAVISLDDDGELLLLWRLRLVLRRGPAQNPQNTSTSMVLSWWKQGCQSSSHQEDEEDGENHKLWTNPKGATGKPALGGVAQLKSI